MTTLVEEMAKAIGDKNDTSTVEYCPCDYCKDMYVRQAQAALDCVTKHLFQMSQIVDTEYRGYLKAVIAHLDQERSRE
jgi:hypothetical protein